jgi:hypothetical protein
MEVPMARKKVARSEAPVKSSPVSTLRSVDKPEIADDTVAPPAVASVPQAAGDLRSVGYYPDVVYPDVVRHALAQVLCCGAYVRESEGGDLVPERALMRFASATTKAVAIALSHGKMVEDALDVEFSNEDAARALIGVSELLAAAPRLLDTLQGFDIRSNGETRAWGTEDAEDSEVAS